MPAFFPLLVLPLAVALPAVTQAKEVLLSVAISIEEATDESGRQFQRTHPGLTLRYNFGASGDLQKQIEAGAPAGLFISTGQPQMDALERQGLLRPGSRRVFARNAPTVIVPATAPGDLTRPADLLRPAVQRIAIGSRKTVPAGHYAEENFRSLGLWDGLRPKLVFAENVRQAPEYVARAEVDAGFVYTSDVAVQRMQVREAFRPSPDSYAPITYPMAVLVPPVQATITQAFLDLLLSPAGQAVLARLGFQPPGGSPR